MSADASLGRALRSWLFQAVPQALLTPIPVLASVALSGQPSFGNELGAWATFAALLGATSALAALAVALAPRWAASVKRDVALSLGTLVAGAAGSILAVMYGGYMFQLARTGRFQGGVEGVTHVLGKLFRNELGSTMSLLVPLALPLAVTTFARLRDLGLVHGTALVVGASGAAAFLASLLADSPHRGFRVAALALALAIHPLGLLAAGFERRALARLGLDGDEGRE